MNITKAKHAFDEKFSRFDEDLELVDYLTAQMENGQLSNQNCLLIGNLDKYETLPRRTKKQRAFARNRSLLATHLKQSMYSSYIKDSYEEVTDYLRKILSNVLLGNDLARKKRVIGNNKLNVSANEIVSFESIDILYSELAFRIIQQLEQERSTLELIKKIVAKLGLTPNDSLIKKSVNFLNVRHYLVHQDGICSDDFIDKVDKNIFKFNSKKYIRLNFEFIKEFRTSIIELVEYLENELVSKNLIEDQFIHLNK